MSEFRKSWNPWNGGYAIPKNVREEDWDQANISPGLPGGWPIREVPVVQVERPVGIQGYDGGLGDGANFLDMPPAVRALAAAAMAYHGYKRNGSMLWASLWSAGGYMSPLFMGAVAFAQGFGKKK